MSLLLGQLIYTSLAKVGFQALTSAEVPPEICQQFIEQIVYQYWDSYNPPSADYRAAYLHQLSANQTLFGWVYNDGADDLGRSHIPYFICYCFAGLLQPIHLESIFTCLSTGPIEQIDRHCLPIHLESILLPEDGRYQPARLGVAIAAPIQERSYLTLQQGKLLKLFAPEAYKAQSLGLEGSIVTQPLLEELTSPDALVSTMGGKQLNSNSAIDAGRNSEGTVDGIESIAANESLEQLSSETYQQLLLAKVRPDASPRQAFRLWHWRRGASRRSLATPFSRKLRLALIAAIALMALAIGGFYGFRLFPVATLTPTSTSASNQDSDNQDSDNRRSENLTLAKTLTEHLDPVWSLVLGSDGKTLISGSDDQTIKIWNVETGTVLNTLSGHTDVVRSLALTPDGRTLVSGSGDRTIKIWDLQSNQPIQTLEQDNPVWSVAISSDAQTLVSGSEDGLLKIWDLPTGELLNTIPAHDSRVFSVTISPDGKTVATASLDQTLKIWDLETGERLRTMPSEMSAGHSAAVRALAFSPDGQTLASASWDNSLILWNWRTGEALRTFVGHTSRVVAVVFSTDGQLLISGSVDNTINLWSAQTGTLLRTLSDHTDWILALAIDSQRLVSASKDQTIRVWQFQQ
ncbi:WD40 repeat domain-containing protein [Myxacorys almedinensis]|uniref:WD40 repeat domain-containing protein n=1 Tax=Myxacorys almedinensis A TaxID=2690445 RepID=A0A8J8CLE3_9CYAN|nr:WD40 repeat domain-containing protein [Myxacorys almedinensis]NDJ19536.1 WD40 repeat domain-containing protein [Myxacorys almedinensis A]